MIKSEAKVGLKVHVVGRGDRPLYIIEVREDHAGVNAVKEAKTCYAVRYERLIKYKNQ